jgi:hypothetical protein
VNLDISGTGTGALAAVGAGLFIAVNFENA